MDASNATSGGTRTMKASEFKAKCLQLMDEVADSGGEIVITKNERSSVSLRGLNAREPDFRSGSRHGDRATVTVGRGREPDLPDPIPIWCQTLGQTYEIALIGGVRNPSLDFGAIVAVGEFHQIDKLAYNVGRLGKSGQR